MRIAELTAFHVRIPLKAAIRHASHTRTETDTLIVRCRLENGTEGWGEGLPRSYVTGETIDTSLDQLRRTDLPSQLAAPIDDLRAAVELCRQLELAEKPPEARDCFGNSVRCAVELSLLDAVARADGVPLSRVTELVPETLGIREFRDSVRYSGAVTSAGPLREMVRACKIRLYGFGQCKVKVGVPGTDDLASLRRLRRILGRRLDVRIDANEAWRCETLEERLLPLLPFDISAVEQPVPHAEVDGLAALRERIPVPIMLDESLCSLGDAHRAVELGTCDLFNIRLSKCGGFLASLQLAGLAYRAGLGYQLGCMVGETGILSAAGRHFATSVGEIRYLEGSYDRFLVRERLSVEDMTFGWGGDAPALRGPGLGVTIDPAALQRVTVRRENYRVGSHRTRRPLAGG